MGVEGEMDLRVMCCEGVKHQSPAREAHSRATALLHRKQGRQHIEYLHNMLIG
jgi:hypothetical protein